MGVSGGAGVQDRHALGRGGRVVYTEGVGGSRLEEEAGSCAWAGVSGGGRGHEVGHGAVHDLLRQLVHLPATARAKAATT